MPYPTYTTESLTATQQINELVGQSNLTATGAPGVNDDCTVGYHVGSRWLNTQSGTWYMCSSAVVGNATWVAVSGGGGGDGPTGPTGPAGPGLTSAEGVSTLSPIGEDTELDVMSPGPMIVSSGGNYNAGTNDTTGSTESSTAALYSGNTESGQSGDVLVYSGTSSAGNSGAVQIASGAAAGVRGNITLDAPAVTHGQLTLGPDPVSQGAYGIVAHNLNIMVDNSDNVDVGAWLFSADVGEGASSVGVGIGTGQSDGGNTADTWVYSGNVTSGSGHSGVVYVESGDVVDGASGSIQIVTGHVTGEGERGSIVLDAPAISAPSGVVIDTGVNPVSFTVSAAVADNGDGSPITFTAGPGGPLSGTGGAITLTSGAGPAAGGNSGNITLATAAAFGTRGNIVLDSEKVVLTNGDVVGQDTSIYVRTSDADGSGSVNVYTGSVDPGGTNASGTANVFSGDNAGSGNTGGAYLYSGVTYGDGTGDSGEAQVSTGSSVAGNTGQVSLISGNAGVNSGDVKLQTGVATGTRGNIVLDAPLVMSPTNSAINVQGGSSGAWIFSADITDPEDTTASGNAGAGSGNTSGSGASGQAALYTGDAAAADSGLIGISTGRSTGGNSGNIGLKTGESTTGNSGDIALIVGTADSTRGKIIIDAPLITSPNVSGSDASEVMHLTSGTVVDGLSGAAGIESGGATGTGGSGTAYLGSSDAGGDTGQVWIYSGASSGGNSGDIHIEVGSADGTRGNIILDARRIATPDATGSNNSTQLYFQSGSVDTGNPGQVGFEVAQGNGTGTGGDAFMGTSDILNGQPGNVSLYTGSSAASGKNGGDIMIGTGTGGSGGRDGLVIFWGGIPTADPHVAGALWNSSGTLKISSGP